MMVNDVYIMEEAVDDLNEGRSFYDLKAPGIGDYFWDCLISDIESLILFAGIHPKKYDFYQMFAKRFPYAVYYEIVQENAYVAAILPMRRDPAWIVKQLKRRR
jgi:hypothetical protein